MSFTGVRIAARGLRKQPVFTAVVVLSLGIGIALNTTMYGILDALVRPRIDVSQPDALYRISFYGDYQWRVDNRMRDSALMTGLHSYEAITRTEGRGNQLIERGQTMYERNVTAVAANYFDVMGTRALVGRTFIPSDEHADVVPVVITDDLADQLFPDGRSPINERIMLDRKARVVVGVVSAAANLPGERTSAWEAAPAALRSSYGRIIRLRTGATRADAERELALVAVRIGAAAGENPRDVAFRLHPAAVSDYQVADFERALILAVVAVLLVACANLANIQLARGVGRRRELALRVALGATRRGVLAHVLTESVLLAAAGLLLGLVLTFWGARAIIATIPPQVGEYIVQPQFSWRVLAFAIGATVFCVLIVGLLPAIVVSRADPNELLKSGAGTGATKRNRGFYAILVGAEIALALALTSGSAALVRTWMHMQAIRSGFDPPIALGFVGLQLPPGRHSYSAVLQSVTERLESLRGVTTAATLSMSIDRHAVTVEDPGGVREYPTPGVAATVVSPSYLRVLGLPIGRGRDFLDGERDHSAVIVDARTARALWPNANPVGALIKLGDMQSTRPFVRVVGVVGDLETQAGTRATAPRAPGARGVGSILYLPGPSDAFDTKPNGLAWTKVIARAESHPEALPLAVRREIAGWPDARTGGIASWDEAHGLTRERRSQRFIASLFTAFAALGVALAAFGVYGVVAHSVAERRREFGVRIALGASRRDILHAVLRESVVVALAGVAMGLLMTKYGVLLLARLVEDEIFNAPLFAGVAVLLVAIVGATAFAPALRATRIDPTESLRSE